ncbi:MAG: EI24 domain-containing protein [Planctomycetota bacterium]|jgi:CysZ protein
MDKYRCQNCGFLAPVGAECPRCEGLTVMAHRFVSPDPKTGWIKNYSVGFGYYMAGFKFIFAHPPLFKYVIIPLIICLLIFVGLVVAALFNIDLLLGFLDREWISVLDWLRHAIYWLAWILLALLAILVSFFLSFLLSTIINSPFYDLLSEKVEDLYLGRKLEEGWSWESIHKMIVIPIRESLKIAAYEIVVMLVLFILSLFSAGLGTVFFAIAGAYFGALTIFDFIMARKYYTLVEKRRYMRSNLGFVMGFGTPVYLLPFLTPFAVVGGTLGFLSSRRK